MLAAGQSPDEIVQFFAARYGDRVLADLPRSGFNLLLFGWVGGSIALVALVGGSVLLRMRSRSAGAAVDAGAVDEDWLDDQLRAPDAAER